MKIKKQYLSLVSIVAISTPLLVVSCSNSGIDQEFLKEESEKILDFDWNNNKQNYASSIYSKETFLEQFPNNNPIADFNNEEIQLIVLDTNSSFNYNLSEGWLELKFGFQKNGKLFYYEEKTLDDLGDPIKDENGNYVYERKNKIKIKNFEIPDQGTIVSFNEAYKDLIGNISFSQVGKDKIKKTETNEELENLFDFDNKVATNYIGNFIPDPCGNQLDFTISNFKLINIDYINKKFKFKVLLEKEGKSMLPTNIAISNEFEL